MRALGRPPVRGGPSYLSPGRSRPHVGKCVEVFTARFALDKSEGDRGLSCEDWGRFCVGGILRFEETPLAWERAQLQHGGLAPPRTHLALMWGGSFELKRAPSRTRGTFVVRPGALPAKCRSIFLWFLQHVLLVTRAQGVSGPWYEGRRQGCPQ